MVFLKLSKLVEIFYRTKLKKKTEFVQFVSEGVGEGDDDIAVVIGGICKATVGELTTGALI